MLSDDESKFVDSAVSSILELDNFISECERALSENRQKKISLLLTRELLKKIVSGYNNLISTMEAQVSTVDIICRDLLKVDTRVMLHVVQVYEGIIERGDDIQFLDVYVRYAELQAELKSPELAVALLRDEHNICVPVIDDSYKYDDMLYDVDASVLN